METTMATNSSEHRSVTPRCVTFGDLFQNPLLEGHPAAVGADDRRRYEQLERSAEAVCQSCPLLTDCLYRSVVDHDVAGYVAASTPRQRSAIRRRLGVTVEPEDFDTLAGVTRRHRQIDHHEVVRLRSANPHESLECLAQRLGCSLSTVKRHLRRERRSPSTTAAAARRHPTPADVWDAYAEVTGSPSRRPAAA